MKEVTDLDHQGALIWIDCPLCGSVRKVDCVSMFMLGPSLIIAAVETGKTHDARVKKWIEFKARVVAASTITRGPNMQQIPRSEPHRISKGGSKEAAEYWENRNKMKAIRQHAKPIIFHASWCPMPKTATCLCGKEPLYSPEKRRERGEIK
jgi:hypothetical protein